MASYRVLFIDGPCGGQVKLMELPAQVPKELRCGGRPYIFQPAPFPGPLHYVLEGGLLDVTPGEIRGKRDALRAWHRLMSELAHGTEKQVRRLSRARQRIRRAVR